ncbi:TRAP transporter small permease [Hydrogenophaga sp.]|uniref:TRAP transporter small permease n=1 Tax=Hydrogenophaga sp. TaxID=1904254 RepID=UPI002730567E|nr:TRAP transporter small permease subunit [Hydrogenophaga sp.]MDP2017642.1 TRAP transporter small permease subunit [Hydrogenophaga sp.]MDP3164218.1 TRAP transporter small permease subunit [Hydrogenophaga sp.]MDP3811403.1 TRAP transporter small permease subunit [Hydrogenophaga sp.]
MSRKLIPALQRAVDFVAAGLLATIFVAFIIQIALRYLFNWPVGWTTEVSVLAWLWLVLWGASFVLKDHEEIRIDFLTANVGRRARIAMGIIAAVCVIVLFSMQLPAAYDYVSFMKVEKSSYMNTRFDVLFSIYLIFSVAVIGRNLWNLVQLLRGIDPSVAPPEQVSSAL